MCISPLLLGLLIRRGVAAPLATVKSDPALPLASESCLFRRCPAPPLVRVTGLTVKTLVRLGTSLSRLDSEAVSVTNEVSEANFRSFLSMMLLAQFDTGGARKVSGAEGGSEAENVSGGAESKLVISRSCPFK